MAGLSGRAKGVGKAWFWEERGSCDLLLAVLGPNFIRAYPVFLSGDGYSKHCRASRQMAPAV
ncbi:MAG: hypothetical protein CME33_12905 [Gimesia sp.]|uniref:hypothetical protein n=1 Tax=Gimesia sp. TaxID=2024833 RepID=UPI000C466254|nr:hypothetical protein [Gimesia sp.]MAX37450.1 hypothetical protein [Gimesia sp.]